MLNRKAILSIKSALSLFSEISLPLAIVYLFRGQKCAHCWVELFHTMLQWHKDIKSCFILFSFSGDSRQSSNIHCSASEH